ncbi:MAG: PmoA family protein [Verrucomicrobiales bacterium]|nr:PmoA family protein [Verrucomicrobiales bacterium]
MRFLLTAFFFALPLTAQDAAYKPDRCEILPLAGHRASLQIDGAEKTRWHWGLEYPRPFFFPFNGPSGVSLTRMGHPGASNHDHHRSVWFAHKDVNGKDFWGDGHGTQIRQKMWFAYEDGDDEAILATLTGWFGKDGTELMEQEIVAALRPMDNGEHALEFQITMRPPANRETVELGKTNFGFLAVRVSKTLSHHFGGGKISNSEGAVGEKNIFGQPARWMDYSGPVVVGEGADRKTVTEGITYFDHPENPRHPVHWHVRSDGWMGAGFCLNEAFTIEKEIPLVLRYLLHAHSGKYDAGRAGKIAAEFAKRPGFEVGKRGTKHRQFEAWRKNE